MARFICLLYVDDAALQALGPEELQRFNAENVAYDRELVASGKLVTGAAMASPCDALTVRRRGDGLSMTDGPYVETKEHVGGFVLFDVADRDELLAILARDPMAAYAHFEIREVKNPADPDWEEWANRTYGPR